jgi:hypothetical protein
MQAGPPTRRRTATQVAWFVALVVVGVIAVASRLDPPAAARSQASESSHENRPPAPPAYWWNVRDAQRRPARDVDLVRFDDRRTLVLESGEEGDEIATAREAPSTAVVVRAPGHAPRVTWFGPGRASRADAHEVSLDPGCGLEARVLGPDGDPVKGAFVRLSLDAIELASDRDPDRPHDHERGVDVDWMSKRVVKTEFGVGLFEWTAVSDDAGRVRFADLPRGAALDVDIELDGHLHAILRRVRPDRDGAASVEWSLTELCDYRGVLVDRDGGPIANMPVLAVPAADEAPAMYFTRGLRSRWSVTTDADGAFELTNVPAGDYYVGCAPRDPAREAGVAARGVRIAIGPSSAARAVPLVVDRGLYIVGLVVDETGAPCSDAELVAVATDGSGALLGSSRDDGTFEIGPVDAGEFLIQGSRAACPCGSVPQRVTPGDPNTLVEVVPSSSISGVVVDGSGSPAEGALELTISGRETGIRRQSVAPSARGAFRVDLLGADVYQLTARATDGRVGVVRAVQLARGAQSAGVEIALGTAARLELRNASPRFRSTLLVTGSDGGVTGTVDLQPGENATLTVPEGETRITRVRGGVIDELASRSLAAGEDFEVLVPR